MTSPHPEQPVEAADWISDELGHALDNWLAPGSVDPSGHNVGPDGEPHGDCYKCRKIRDFIRDWRAARASVALDGAAIRRAIDEACSLTNPRLSEVEWDAVAARLTDPSR
jgi:hypothetical protein